MNLLNKVKGNSSASAATRAKTLVLLSLFDNAVSMAQRVEYAIQDPQSTEVVNEMISGCSRCLQGFVEFLGRLQKEGALLLPLWSDVKFQGVILINKYV